MATHERTANRRTSAAKVALAALVLVAAGCLPDAKPWQGPANGITVGVLGDSQVYQAEHDTTDDDQQHLTDQLVAAGYRESHSAFFGAKTGDLAAFGDWPDGITPQILVLGLGVNDMTVDPDTGQSKVPLSQALGNVDTYLARLPSACVVFVTIPQTTPWGLDTTGPPWNSAIKQRAANRNGVIVPWNGLTKFHPEYLLSDGVHQTEVGRAAFRDAIVTGVDECAQKVAAG